MRLASLTGDPAYRDHAEKTLKLFAPQMTRNPRGTSNLALAMNEFLDNQDYRSLTQRVRQSENVVQTSPTNNVPSDSRDAPTGPPPGELPVIPTKPADGSPAIASGN